MVHVVNNLSGTVEVVLSVTVQVVSLYIVYHMILSVYIT